MSEKQKALDSGAPDAAEQRRIQGALFAEEVKVRPAFPTRPVSLSYAGRS